MKKQFTFYVASGECEIRIGEARSNVQGFLSATRYVVIAEVAVADKGPLLLPLETKPRSVITIAGGESCKCLSAAESLYAQLLSHEVDRATVCVAIGGGALLDLAGFVAATYLRGLRLVSIPTTLLAQVDASVGGKNGVDFHGFKNIIGTVRQPACVVLDVNSLVSLPEQEFVSGLAEVVKAAVIADTRFFEWLETHLAEILRRDRNTLEELVSRSVQIKLEIVGKDELELGERRKLNYGHTVGHAVELAAHLRHGEAISIGMTLEARFAVSQKWQSEQSLVRLRKLLESMGLPVDLTIKRDELLKALVNDKKREGETLHLPVVSEIGHSHIRQVSMGALSEFFR